MIQEHAVESLNLDHARVYTSRKRFHFGNFMSAKGYREILGGRGRVILTVDHQKIDLMCRYKNGNMRYKIESRSKE